MPVSTTVHISHCLGWIIQTDPSSILDVGCGFGTWGFLCREHLDVARERVQPEEWQVRIDGIELFEPYIQPHQRALYSSIAIGDIRELAPRIEPYDLIIAGDVIEHLEKNDGEEVLRVLYEKATKALLVNIPLEGNWDHPERHGNPGELHRSQWAVEDFLPFPSVCEVFTLPCGTYGSFLCPKSCTVEQRLEGLLAAAEHMERVGRLDNACRHLRTAQALDPRDERVAMFLADLLIRSGDQPGAVAALDQTVAANPAFHYGRLALARLLLANRQSQAGHDHLEYLLHDPSVSEDLRSSARHLRSS